LPLERRIRIGWSDADAAIAASAPTVKRPVALGSDWISVGLDGHSCGGCRC